MITRYCTSSLTGSTAGLPGYASLGALLGTFEGGAAAAAVGTRDIVVMARSCLGGAVRRNWLLGVTREGICSQTPGPNRIMSSTNRDRKSTRLNSSHVSE